MRELFLFSCGEERLRTKIEMEALANLFLSIIETIKNKEIPEKKLESLNRIYEVLWELLKEDYSKELGYNLLDAES